MRDVPFVAERDIFKSRLRIGADHACQPADLLARNWVSLVRHRGRSLLSFAEVLFGFADFGPLQVPNLSRDLVERAGDYRQGRDVRRMPVALNHLSGHRDRLQSKAFADLLLVLRIEVAEAPYRSRQLTHAHVFSSMLETSDVPLHLRMPIGQLQSESSRFSVDSVSASDCRRVFELERAPLDNLGQILQIIENQTGCFLDLKCLSCVNHIVGGETIMQPARFRANLPRNSCGESDYIVLHFSLNLPDPLYIECCA